MVRQPWRPRKTVRQAVRGSERQGMMPSLMLPILGTSYDRAISPPIHELIDDTKQTASVVRCHHTYPRGLSKEIRVSSLARDTSLLKNHFFLATGKIDSAWGLH